MPNPFDQFDDKEANPFDRFDGKKQGVFSKIVQMGKGVTPEGVTEAVDQRREDIIGQYADRNKFQDQRWQDLTYASDPDVSDEAWAKYEKSKSDLEREIGIAGAEAAEWKPLKAEKMSRPQAFTTSLIQSGLEIPGLGHAVYGAAGALTGEDPKDLRTMARSAKKEAREDHPVTSLGGDITSFAAPGAAIFRGGTKVVQGTKALLPASLRAAVTPSGSGVAARLGRYVPQVVAPTSAAAAIDYGAYNATVEAGNRAADEGREVSLKERWDMFGEGVSDPYAWAMGGAMSPIYRAGRGLVTAGKNTIDATRDAGKLKLRPGSLTPTPRAQWAEEVMQEGTPVSRAYEMVAKRMERDGVTPEMLSSAIDNYQYAGYSSVEEMLFEIAEAATKNKGGGQIKQLAVALGSVGGDAQQSAREAFRVRKAGMPGRIREELRKAAGIEGADFYQYGDELDAASRTMPKPLYDEAYGKSIRDSGWDDTVLPLLETSPSARKALSEAAEYARDTGELAVAREIDDLRTALAAKDGGAQMAGVSAHGRAGASKNVPQKPSTQALDYIDRMLGDSAEGIRRSSGRKELARGPATAQTRLRSVLDTDTGLNVGRDKSAELKAASKALDFGRKGFANGQDLETLQREFAKESGRYGGEHIDPALLMGWMRGAEDAVERATNPGAVIRQLYGSERQRAKLLEMLPSGEGLGSGTKSDLTKRRRVLTGDDKSGRVGRFERERRMLDSENQIVGNSQTGQRNEAIAAQGGVQRMTNAVIDTLQDTKKMAGKAVRHGVDRVTRPGIFNPKVNRELGDILFKGGRENLDLVVKELAKRSGKKPTSTISPKEGKAAVVKALTNKPAQAGFIDPAMLSKHPGVAGGLAGGALAQDIDGDGRVSLKERALFAAGGAVGAKSATTVGSKLLPPKQFRPGQVPSQAEWERATYGDTVRTADYAKKPLGSSLGLGEYGGAAGHSKRLRNRAARDERRFRATEYKRRLPSKKQIDQAERQHLLEKGYEPNDAGVLIRRSEKSDYDLNNKMFRVASHDSGSPSASLSYDEGFERLPGLALPIQGMRPPSAKVTEARGWVWLADSKAAARQLAGVSPHSRPSRGRGISNENTLELVSPRGPRPELTLRPGMKPDQVTDLVASEFAKGAPVVRLTIPQQRVGDTLVPKYSVIVAKKSHLRSTDAAFDPKKSGLPGVMNGLPLLAAAGSGAALSTEGK